MRILLVVVTIALVGAGASIRHTKIVAHPDPTLVVSATSPESGVIDVTAAAKHTSPFRDATLWWCVDVYRNGQRAAVASHEYVQPRRLVGARKGSEIKPAFHDRLQGIPAGHYRVMVGLRENLPMWLANGEPLADSSVVIARSAMVDVN